MQAFVLAAGKGTRLLPYTRYVPKPLFHILGKPLLEIILDNIRSIGITRIGLNIHHLPSKMKSFLAFYQKTHPHIQIEIFEEPQILGPIGAFLGAKDFFKEDTLVINADILTNFPLSKLIQAHKHFGGVVTLLLHKHPKYNKILVDGENVQGFSQDSSSAYAYTGIKIISKEFVSYLPSKAREFVPSYNFLLKKGFPIKALIGEDFYWQDIGTLTSYLKAHEDLLLRKIPILSLKGYEHSFVFPLDLSTKELFMEEWVFLEKGVRVFKGTRLRKVVAWQGARIPYGYHKEMLFI